MSAVHQPRRVLDRFGLPFGFDPNGSESQVCDDHLRGGLDGRTIVSGT
jgi:hypothetical protein